MENIDISCEACRDLLPLYADGVASGESSALVEAHIAACGACGAELSRLKTVLPSLKKSPKKVMRTVKQKLRTRRILIGLGAGIGAAVLLTGLFAFVLSYSIPVKSPPKDLKFSVADGVFKATSAVDSQFTNVRMTGLKAEDGSDINLVIFSMGNPAMRKLWPALNRRIYTMGPPGFWFEEHGMEIVIPLELPEFPEPPEPPEPPDPPELFWLPWFPEPPGTPGAARSPGTPGSPRHRHLWRESGGQRALAGVFCTGEGLPHGPHRGGQDGGQAHGEIHAIRHAGVGRDDRVGEIMPLFEPFELKYISAGLVCGVDEAGRGPLAGDVYAAAVILPQAWDLPGLNDSKQCTAKVRERLCADIKAQAIAWAVGIATVDEIAEINILRAALLAMKRAVEALSPPAAFALVDGNQRPPLSIPCETIVHGDARCASVAAASILAKVTRDRAMVALDEEYPGYGFAQHKGYGTRAHYEALEKLGPCFVHRLGFLH